VIEVSKDKEGCFAFYYGIYNPERFRNKENLYIFPEYQIRGMKVLFQQQILKRQLDYFCN